MISSAGRGSKRKSAFAELERLYGKAEPAAAPAEPATAPAEPPPAAVTRQHDWMYAALAAGAEEEEPGRPAAAADKVRARTDAGFDVATFVQSIVNHRAKGAVAAKLDNKARAPPPPPSPPPPPRLLGPASQASPPRLTSTPAANPSR